MRCGGQNTSECRVKGETCIDGVCRCSSSSSCEGRKTGAFCDPILGECRCSEITPSCPASTKGNICDSDNNYCTCSATGPACNETEFCTLESCVGNTMVLE